MHITTMMNVRLAGLLGFAMVGLLAGPSLAVTVTTDEAGGNDGSIRYFARDQDGLGNPAASSWDTVTGGVSGSVIGHGGSTPSRTTSAFVMAFRLPELPEGMQVESAQLEVFLEAFNGTPSFNADLWGLGFQSASTITAGTVGPDSTGDFNDVDGDGDPGPNDSVEMNDTMDLGTAYGISARVKLVDNLLTSGSTPSDTVSISTGTTAALVDYIQSLYDNGAVGGASGDFVFFRLSQDAALASGSARYELYTNNDAPGAGAVAPALSIEFAPIPEPGAAALMGLGGMLLLGRSGRKQ